MKIKHIILICLFFTASIYGCKKLDETIYDTPSVGNSVNTAADISLGLAGTYGIFQNLEDYKKEAMKLMEGSADHMSAVSTTEFGTFSQKIYEPGTGQISSVYSRHFSVVNNCNFLLDKLPGLKIDSVFKARAEGEIKFLRAFAYFDLVRLFGEVPLKTKSTDINSDLYAKRDSVSQIYNLIFSDLKTANLKLKDRSVTVPTGLGYTNKGAAQAMYALASLTYGNYLERNGKSAAVAYTDAKNYADSVILSGKYSLVNNYADLWDAEKEVTNYTSEVIFGIRFTRDKNASSSASKGSEYAQRWMPNTIGGSTGNITVAQIGSGGGSYKVQPWFYIYCTTGDYLTDYRAEATFLTSWLKNNSTTSTFVTFPLIPGTGQAVEPTSLTNTTLLGKQPYVKKYVDGKGLDASNHENDLYILRLSEVYLIKAEAENELNGPTAAAYTAFNMLRARARKANGTARSAPADLSTTSGLTKDQFRKKIFDERGLEFVGECKRWFDLVRMKGPSGTGTMYEYMFGTYLPTLPSGLPSYSTSTKTWSSGRTEPTSIVAYNSKFLLFPIPQRERDLNPKLTQNPLY